MYRTSIILTFITSPMSKIDEDRSRDEDEDGLVHVSDMKVMKMAELNMTLIKERVHMGVKIIKTGL